MTSDNFFAGLDELGAAAEAETTSRATEILLELNRDLSEAVAVEQVLRDFGEALRALTGSERFIAFAVDAHGGLEPGLAPPGVLFSAEKIVRAALEGARPN